MNLTVLAIKQGQWTIKEVLDYADQLEAEIDMAAEKSELPKKPRFDEIEKFTIHLVTYFGILDLIQASARPR